MYSFLFKIRVKLCGGGGGGWWYKVTTRDKVSKMTLPTITTRDKVSKMTLPKTITVPFWDDYVSEWNREAKLTNLEHCKTASLLLSLKEQFTVPVLG